MEQQRLFLWGLLSLVAFFMFQAWQKDYGPKPPIQNTEQVVEQQAVAPDVAGLDVAGVDAPTSTDQAGQTRSGVSAVNAAKNLGKTVTVQTDVFDLQFSTQGARLQGLVLKDFPKKKKTPNDLVTLFALNNEETFLLDSGLRAGGVSTEPTHQTLWQINQTSFDLGQADTLSIPFTWRSPEGLEVTKTYQFTRGSYQFSIDYAVQNNTGQTVAVRSYAQMQREHPPQSRSLTDVSSYSYKGPTWYNGEKYEKLSVGDIEEDPISENITNGWLAMIQQHFVAAIVPEADKPSLLMAKADGPLSYRLTASAADSQNVPAGGSLQIQQQFFAGPKFQKDLNKLHPKLNLTTDYGAFSMFSKPLFWLLSIVQGFVINWGWSIILVTVVIKLAFYPLTAKSSRSMAKMKKVQPRLKLIQERYKDDRQKLSAEMMNLYKKEKINPAAGCLPILLQFPVLLGFYWLLLESAELRQQPWAFWIQDLSATDPLFILPVVYGGLMFLQQKVTPMSGANPDMMKVMKFMPIGFAVFMIFFPAGLLLYWITNSVLTILQQWRINKMLEKEDKAYKKLG